MRRSSFYSCMDIIESLRGTSSLVACKISKRSSVNADKLNPYLKFLKNEGMIDSIYSGKNEKYFLTQGGFHFIREWNKYRIEADLDKLKKQLEIIV